MFSLIIIQGKSSMSRLCTISISKTLLLFLFPFFCSGQASIDTALFIKHLDDQDLVFEKIAFLKSIRNNHLQDKLVSDSLTLQIALTGFKAGLSYVSDELSLVTSGCDFKENNSKLFLYMLILRKNNPVAKKQI